MRVLQLGPGLGPGGLRGPPEGASTISFTFITKALAGSRLGISRAIAADKMKGGATVKTSHSVFLDTGTTWLGGNPPPRLSACFKILRINCWQTLP